MRRAGADYVLALPEITGRLLAREVLHENVLTSTRQLSIVKIDAADFAGRTVEEAILAETDCLVLAVERDGTLHTDVPVDFRLRADDDLVVLGADEDVDAVR